VFTTIIHTCNARAFGWTEEGNEMAMSKAVWFGA
jgi:hypothetical protein